MRLKIVPEKEFQMFKAIVVDVVVYALLTGCSSLALAADSKKAPDNAVTKEQRQKMAQMHEKMAKCLRSDRPFSECHDEMRKGCKDMGKDGCPMMQEMHGMKHSMEGGSH